MHDHHCRCCKLSVVSFAFATGITWALGILFLGFIAMKYDVGGPVITLLGSIYKGYDASMGGAWWGALWGLIDGFIGGAVLAYIYNLCLRCCKECRKKQEIISK